MRLPSHETGFDLGDTLHPAPYRDKAVPEVSEAARERAQRQLDVSAVVDGRGVGKAAFDTAGGWSAEITNEKRFRKACAEWADGELVIAHIAYRNDVLCTHDRARTAGRSIFRSHKPVVAYY